MRTHRFLLLAGLLLTVAPLAAQDKPLPPAEAPRHMTVPDGFQVTLFAGEPDVVQPIAFTFDDRGRLWVAECTSYPNWITNGGPGRDRILIFEDTDGDGRFDTCKVFADKLANVSGIEVGFGGVWVCSTPNLLFIPDRDGDDKPDGPPEVVLNGWDVLKAQHNVFNSLTWGPDGWLYGCNGIQSQSRVGAPGTPDAQRVPLNCGVWRYHPTRRQFEVVASGTTNPWGLDFDDYGEMWITNCVIAHLWHVIPGAHFQRMHGQDLNPYVYGLMNSPADHLHWAGGPWQSSRGAQGKHGEAGGGHAHVGAMVYLGDNWPERYRGGIFMCNLHGNRVNHDTPERHGSGYVAHHAPDFLFANDPWFRGLALHQGPDGGVFISDWTDTGECHNYKEVDRTNGRLYKVTYGKVKPWHGDIGKLSDAELVNLQLHHNDWHVRHARRVLQERAAAGKLAAGTHDLLRRMLAENPDVTRQLRALWALAVTGGVDEPFLLGLLNNTREEVRGWAIRLALEERSASPRLLGRLTTLSKEDPAASVRLALASGLQRLPLDKRWPIAEALAGHAIDARDANLPLMIWYGVEPLAPAEPERAAGLIGKAEIPIVRQYLTRRIASLETAAAGLGPLVRLLGRVSDPAVQRDVLQGIQEALEGRRQVPMPEGWIDVYAKLVASSDDQVRQRCRALAVLFGDIKALAAVRRLVIDATAPLAEREGALHILLDRKDGELLPVLQALVDGRALRGPAIRGLAVYGDPATPRLLLGHYAAFTSEEKADAIQTLAGRPAYALALLDGIEQGRVARRDVSAFVIRQLQQLKDRKVQDRLKQVWGEVRPASQEKAALTAKYKAQLTADALQTADRSHGRAVYAKTCASCHRLFGEGGDVGPELTGSQRANLDYVLENVLDPSAIVPNEYQVTVLTTRDGRLLTGIIKQETERSVTVQTQNEKVIVPRDEIEARAKSPVSMMPEGLLDLLSKEEVRDLVAYLASPNQVPLPAGGSR